MVNTWNKDIMKSNFLIYYLYFYSIVLKKLQGYKVWVSRLQISQDISQNFSAKGKSGSNWNATESKLDVMQKFLAFRLEVSDGVRI